LAERRERLGGSGAASFACPTPSGAGSSAQPFVRQAVRRATSAPLSARMPAREPLDGQGDAPAPRLAPDPSTLGYCRHKIFGRGKVIGVLDDGKYRVNFPDFGPKVILAAFLEMEGAASPQA
jgi:DNA helicase-2/ATP-dependent DNA helicase PcrA